MQITHLSECLCGEQTETLAHLDGFVKDLASGQEQLSGERVVTEVGGRDPESGEVGYEGGGRSAPPFL